ncbi:MAG: DNA recombination/repair protein RecA, partial [Gemmatimonadota bacterium]
YGDDVRLGQGRENAKAFLIENPDIADEIEARLRRELGLTPDEDAGDAEGADDATDDEAEAAKEGAA